MLNHNQVYLMQKMLNEELLVNSTFIKFYIR